VATIAPQPARNRPVLGPVFFLDEEPPKATSINARRWLSTNISLSCLARKVGRTVLLTFFGCPFGQTREDEDADEEEGEVDNDFVDKEYYPPQSNLEVEDDGLFTK